MTTWLTSSQLAQVAGISRRNVTMAIQRGIWRGCALNVREVETVGGRGGVAYEVALASLPEAIQAAYAKSEVASEVKVDEPNQGAATQADAPKPKKLKKAKDIKREIDPDELWATYHKASQSKKNEAQRRLDVIESIEVMKKQGSEKGEAIEQVRGNESRATIFNWYSLLKNIERQHWLAALCPSYVGCTHQADIEQAAWDFYVSDYLRNSQPAESACYERLQRTAKEKGWNVPSVATLRRRLEKEVPHAVIVLKRQGADALKRLYPSQRRDRSVFHAMEAVNADGHKFDVFVDFGDGNATRPLMLAWQDLYSGKFLSWRIQRTENADAVRLSFGDMVTHYGIPEKAYLDNGRGFASKWLSGQSPNRYRFKIKPEEPTGVLTALGVEIHWTTPYSGQSKPIERGFRDFCEYISKHPAFEGAYTGNKVENKPANYGSKAIPIADFVAVLNEEIAHHNARPGRRSEVCQGLYSFDQVFSESYAKAIIRKPSLAQKSLWLLAAEGVSARKSDGQITLMDNWYWHEALSAYRGRKLVVRFDPDHLHSGIYVYTMDAKLICYAAATDLSGFNDKEAAEEHAKKRNKFAKTVKQAAELHGQLTAEEVAAQLPAAQPAETAQSKVIQPSQFQSMRDKHGGVETLDEEARETAFQEGVARLREQQARKRAI